MALLLTPPGRGDPGLLGPATMTYPEHMRDLVLAAQRSPGDASRALLAAEALIEEGRARGDAVPVRAAATLLAQHTETGPSADLLTTAAIARQYLHEFDPAIALLDASLRQEPGDAQALLTRANIHLVQGAPGKAAQDCQRLAATGRLDLAVLCATSAAALGPQARRAASQLEQILTTGRMDPNLIGYGWSVLGEIALFQEKPEDAIRHFDKAREADPETLRTLMLSADAYLEADQPRGALAVLAGKPDTDAILVRRAIALKRLDEEDALAPIATRLDRRFAANINAGESAHAREEARFYLQVTEDYDLALSRAEANWARQREYEDAWLLIEAANAAGLPHAAAPVQRWMRNNAIAAPGLTGRIAAYKDK